MARTTVRRRASSAIASSSSQSASAVMSAGIASATAVQSRSGANAAAVSSGSSGSGGRGGSSGDADGADCADSPSAAIASAAAPSESGAPAMRRASSTTSRQSRTVPRGQRIRMRTRGSSSLSSVASERCAARMSASSARTVRCGRCRPSGSPPLASPRGRGAGRAPTSVCRPRTPGSPAVRSRADSQRPPRPRACVPRERVARERSRRPGRSRGRGGPGDRGTRA